MNVSRDGERLPLPPSKKTRALLAFLVLTGRTHRRERLCTLLWDVADDPRGALRWSLSKLRHLVDEPARKRIVADRETVAFEPAGAAVDLFTVRDRLVEGAAALETPELVALAGEFRGELLEGLELSDFYDFQSWSVAQREEARRLQIEVLGALVGRLRDQPRRAVPYARALVQADPLDERARATLVRLLAADGAHRQAKQEQEAAERMFRELGAAPRGELLSSGLELQRIGRSGPRAPKEQAAEPPEPAPPPSGEPQATALVGRARERARLLRALDEAFERRREQVFLITGEPGVGKTRLLAEITAEGRSRGATVLDARAYEAEGRRPDGPWIDALRLLSRSVLGGGPEADLAPLLPELAPAGADAEAQSSRERLFGAVAELIASRSERGGVLLVFDDVQWLDEASAELLHYVLRMNLERRVMVALSARPGEIPDNGAALRLLNGLRRDGRIDELELQPLGREEIEDLVSQLGGELDSRRVYTESAGNPLFALEVARARLRADEEVPPTLTDVIRGRLDRLPHEARDVLRWSSLLGHSVDVRRLERLTALNLDGLMSALEVLERHALLKPREGPSSPGATYTFCHEVVRRVVHGEMSAPRRRLMHLRIAELLQEADPGDEELAAELAFHAGLAGEGAIAARACVAAGRRCLRLFANAEAASLARRGFRYAAELPEPDRTALLIELMEIDIGAGRPEDTARVGGELEALAERALAHGRVDHARLGFHLLSYLRWEEGAWGDAERHMREAERVSRAAEGPKRAAAMAEAAKCLAMLERDLGHAEALLLEARALARPYGEEPLALNLGLGMLELHRGALDEADRLLASARDLARAHGGHADEYQAIEQRVLVALQRGDREAARGLSEQLCEIGEKLREGSEAPFARALAALADYGGDPGEAASLLERAVSELRDCDAKHRLAFTLTRAASLDLERGAAELARRRAEEALGIASALDRPSEIALARAIAADASERLGDRESAARHRTELGRAPLRALSAEARAALERQRSGNG